jgi:outer membrane lipoprotein-sorting protein
MGGALCGSVKFALVKKVSRGEWRWSRYTWYLRSMKRLGACSVLWVAVTAGLTGCLTGCLSTTRQVLKVQAPETYRTESVEQVVKDVTARDAAIRTLNAQVLVTAATGGAKEGKVKVYTSFKGYIFVQKPAFLRVILQLPLVGLSAMDMVSDGQTFTLKTASSHGNVWRQGSDTVTTPSKNGLENLRPAVFLDSLLVPGVKPDEYVTMTETTRVLRQDAHKKTEMVEPDYDLNVLEAKSGNILQVKRVVKIDRVSMLPYEQDIYDANGKVATEATYEAYQDYGGVKFPAVITIRRPVDEYSLKIDVTKLTLNETFEADQFELKVPPGAVVKKMP